VSQKILPPAVFWIFSEWLRIFNQIFFTPITCSHLR